MNKLNSNLTTPKIQTNIHITNINRKINKNYNKMIKNPYIVNNIEN